MDKHQDIDSLIHAIRQHVHSIRRHLAAMNWRQSDITAKMMTAKLNLLRQRLSEQPPLSESTQISLIALERDVRTASAFIQQSLNEQQRTVLKVEKHQRALRQLGNQLSA